MAIYQGHNEDSSGNLLLSIGNGMTATVETGSTASQAYTKGSYLFFDNRLCKAASAIASGATLTIGGNLTQTSIGAEITSHLRSSDGKEFYFDVKDGQYGYYPSASKTASEFVPFGGTSDLSIRSKWTRVVNSATSSTSATLPSSWTWLIIAYCHPSEYSATNSQPCKTYTLGDSTTGSSNTGFYNWAIYYKDTNNACTLIGGSLSLNTYQTPKVELTKVTLPSPSGYYWNVWYQ